MANSYVVTCQKSTAVLCSLVCRFSSPVERNIIIARGNFLEVHVLSAEGLVPLANLPFYGKISSIDKVKSPYNGDNAQELVFVLTDRKEFCILGYDMVTKRIVCHVSGNSRENSGHSIERGGFGIIDPQGKMLGLFVVEGILNVYPIQQDACVGQDGTRKLKLSDVFSVHIEQLNVIAITFLHGCSRPTLCVLFDDHEGNRHVKTLVIDMRERELLEGPWQHKHVEKHASIVIPVPSASGGGIILVGQSTICYLNGKSTPESISMQPTNMCVHSAIDAAGNRYLLGDQHGMLYVLVLLKKADGACAGLALSRLGVTSIPSSVNYLDNGVVFVGSRFGDAQLIKLLPTKAPTQPTDECIEVLESYPNLGPILDMCLIPQYKTGGGPNTVVVTCSGAYKDGSLRVIRSGVGVQEQASMDVLGTLGIWSLKKKEVGASAGADVFDKYLIQTYIGETRFLCLKDDELEECEIDGMMGSEQSIYCGNVIGGMAIQVTSNAVRLVQYDDPVSNCNGLKSQYVSPTKITVATANASQILLVASGGILTYLVVDVVSNSLVEVSSIKLDKDVACLSLLPSSSVSAKEVDIVVDAKEEVKRSNLAVLGMWTDESIRFIALPTSSNAKAMVQVSNISLKHGAQIRDILLVSLGNGMSGATGSTTIETTSSTASIVSVEAETVHLLCGMGDGTLISFVVNLPSESVTGHLPTISSRRRVSIGTKPISFSLFMGNGSSTLSPSCCVFASCDRPTIIYQQNSRLFFSAVNLPISQEVTLMTSCHSALFPRCLALVNNTGLMIGTLDDEIRKLHVYSHPLGEGPRRICYSAEHNLFAVCTQKTSITARGEVSVERVLFLDSDTYEQVHVFELEPLESAMACACLPLDTGNGVSEYFVIGTAVCIPNEAEPSNGRIVVFEVSSSAAVPAAPASPGVDMDQESSDITLNNSYSTPEISRGIDPVCIHMVKGAVFSVVGICHQLAAGVGSKVQIFKVTANKSLSVGDGDVFGGVGTAAEIKHVCTHNGHILALHLKAHDDAILVGDLLRSVSLLKYTRGSACKLEEVARDYNTNPMRAVEFFNDPTRFSIGAEDYGNIFLLERKLPAKESDSTSPVVNDCLAVHAEFHVGDAINVMRAGTVCSTVAPVQTSEGVSDSLTEVTDGDVLSAATPTTGKRKKTDAFLSSSPSGNNDLYRKGGSSVEQCASIATNANEVYSSVLYGTVSGSIGAILAIGKESHLFFSILEQAMRKVVRGIGGFSHESWRHPNPLSGELMAYASTAQGFVVDGDLIEIFVDLSSDDKSIVVKHFNDTIMLSKARVEANTAAAAEKVTVGSSSIASNPLPDTPVLFSSNSPDQWTVEAVVQRVEDMIRLH